MGMISESELLIVVLSNATYRLNIIQSKKGGFRVTVDLNNQDGELDLVTFRKKPREWASLDRLTKHIREKYGAVPTMTLTLFPGDISK